MNNDTNKLYIFDNNVQYVLFEDVCGSTYCSLVVDMIQSDHDLKPDAIEGIKDIIKQYLKLGNVKRGAITYGVNSNYIYTPRFRKSVYLQVRKDILKIVENPGNYEYLKVD